MQIRCSEVERSLETVGTRLDSILGYSAGGVIARAKSGLRVSKEQFAKGAQSRWGFRIDPSEPLEFRETETKQLRVRVDLFMQAYWDAEPATQPAHLAVVIRVWSLDDFVYYRPDLDAQRLKDLIDPFKGRVILRLHFDLANAEQPGPTYHMQVGGNSRDDELHWFPKALSVPRFLHMPVDLVLATELVASTFYPREYKQIRREDMWTFSRRISQTHLLHDYLEKAQTALRNNNSVLEALWNVPWDS